MYLPGEDEPVVVRPFLGSLLGDQPGLHGMIGMYTGVSHHACHECCFPTLKQSTPYDPTVHLTRCHEEQAKAQELSEKEFLNDYRKAPQGVAKARDWLKAWKAKVRDR
jgi:hypothetical protein